MLKKLFQGLDKVFIIVALCFMVTGCVSTQQKKDLTMPVIPAKRPVSEIVKPDVTYTIDAYDPWEGFNRSMYKFNYYFDRYLYLPVVTGYETIMPDFLENRVSSFFNNIGEFKNLTNSILQLNPVSSGKTLGRFVLNSTVGLGGLFDVATQMGIDRQNEDFGQTLGHYGVGPGPYLVLPVMGPSSLRDTTGLVVDSAARTAVYEGLDLFENAEDKDWIEAGIYGLEAVDKRHLESFRYYETGSPFEYDLIRLLYLKKRQLDIVKKEAVKPQFTPHDFSEQLNQGRYQKKVDNFLVIFDASSSMSEQYQSERKFEQARRLIDKFNQTIPPLTLEAGLLLFGPAELKDDSKLMYGMTAYSKTTFADRVDGIRSTGGTTPFTRSLEVAGKNLAQTKGNTAVIIFSDAEDVSDDAVKAAKVLKAQYPSNLCLYPVVIGNQQAGRDLMTRLARIGECGFVTEGSRLSSADAMAAFVEAIFLKKVPDTDQDGVLDPADLCPDTPEGVIVDTKGCPFKIDSDEDGVVDAEDKCPGTPRGLEVDSAGCPPPVKELISIIEDPVTLELDIKFDFDASYIRPTDHTRLQEFADFVQSRPDRSVHLEGHTDNVGSPEYNLDLSKKRAESVKNYLVDELEMKAGKITTKGYGASKPIAPNDTEVGRQKNRRVSAIVSE